MWGSPPRFSPFAFTTRRTYRRLITLVYLVGGDLIFRFAQPVFDKKAHAVNQGEMPQVCREIEPPFTLTLPNQVFARTDLNKAG